MTSAVRGTYTPQVLAGIGNFGALYDASALKEMNRPVLVASTDGVGTKTMVAARLNRWNTIGADLVNHCLNDILVQGARPLFFLDYVASSRLDPDQMATVVTGVANACIKANCALIGGETAEMPGVYHADELDLVGTVIGVVDYDDIIDGARIGPGDVVLGLPSSGLHTNGYSLARRVLADLDWDKTLVAPDTESAALPLGDVLLRPHRAYVQEIDTLRKADVDVHGLAHVTGGGIVENLPRILPEGNAAVIRRGQWPEPPIFGLIQRRGAVSDDEMFRTFNMGLGMLVVIPAAQVGLARQVLPGSWRVGDIVAGGGEVAVEPAA